MKSFIARHTVGFIASYTLCSAAVQAEFLLDFAPDDGGALGTSFIHGNSVIAGTTPFLMRGGLQLPEIVIDPDTGLDYFHIIMGDPESGFMQDVYIERGFTSFQGGAGSAVGGGGHGNNNFDPLGVNSASGEANPRKTLVRQIISDGEIHMDFVKDRFDRKPLVLQMLNNSEMNSVFQLDMRNSSYSDNTTPGTLSYTMSLADDYQDAADFNLATDAENSVVTGGRYTYTDGSGPGGSAGTYGYAQGNFDLSAVTWEAYFDHSLTNQWAYTTNRPVPP